jgi:cation-transporting P-type ATPase E
VATDTATLRGLTAAEVAERIARGDVNDVPAAPTRTVSQIVRANVFTRFNALLGGMLAIILVVGPVQDALFGFVLVANALIGIVQELRAKRTLDRLTVLTAPKARAMRDGQERELAVGEVVLDDVLTLRAGDQIVVDGEVLAASGLEVDESLITGESDPVVKTERERVLSGSFVAAGSGTYRATRVGREAYAVSLAEEARRFTLTHSELRSAIDKILTIVTFAIVPTAALLFISQLRNQSDVRAALAASVAGTVAMVPEGLVLLTSLAFAVGVMRLAKRRVLVQELQAVEGLARIDVLCIDKTGTLTEGKLVVDGIEVLDRTLPYEAALAALAAAEQNPNATLTAIGERFADPPGDWAAGETTPFSSVRKWSGASFGPDGTWILGAPDVVLPAAGDDPAVRAQAEAAAAKGSRVLLLARTDAGLSGEVLPEPLAPAALVILGDRPRPDAAETLRYFAEQAVRVKVISGDHPRTVAAIAGRLGLPGTDDPVDARTMTEDPAALADLMESHSVFGRVTPRQKSDMVHALQSRGHVVAMTGDGVNDVLALKDADIGVAMGSGSAATRSVAQVILLDSTFDALPPVVAEGRRVLGNIERTSGLYLTKTVYAMLISLAVGVAGLVFPFLPRHLTLVGSLTIGIPSFFLALAPNIERARPGFLGRVARFAIPAGSLAAIATFLAYRLVEEQSASTLGQARTAAVMVLTWIGLLVLTIVAAPLTARRLALIWSMAGLFLVVMVVPAAREFFALETPPLIDWLAAFGIASLVWSFARLFVPADRPVGPRAPDATSLRQTSGADPPSRAAT